MRVLIAVMTCARDRSFVHRELLCGHGADVRFFLGQGNENPAEDEVIVGEPDDYYSLPHKVRAAFRWALEQGYDYIFKCDYDTWVDVPALLASGFEGHEYIGLMGDEGEGGGLAHCPSGGVGYWLSARAARIYLEHYQVYGSAHPGPFHQFEDWCLAIVLHDYVEQTGDQTLRPHHDPRYWNPGALDWKLGPREKKDCITLHPWEAAYQ
jgi:hypothetical protein